MLWTEQCEIRIEQNKQSKQFENQRKWRKLMLTFVERCLVFVSFTTLLLLRKIRFRMKQQSQTERFHSVLLLIQLLVTMLLDELWDRVHVPSNSCTYTIDNASDDLELEGFIPQNIIFNIKQSQPTWQFRSYELFHEQMSATWSTQQPVSRRKATTNRHNNKP